MPANPLTQLLQEISAWAEERPAIRALIITGFYTRDRADDLSDLHIEMFVTTPQQFAEADHWMSEIRNVWVYLPRQNEAGDPTRLVIFQPGLKVDFTIRPADTLAEMVGLGKIPLLYHRGYQILIDRDRLAAKLLPPSATMLMTRVPTKEEFISLISEFWFEAYHVAKYLKRGDSWVAKFRDWALKELLLTMIEWHKKTLHGWDYDTKHLGTQMRNWVELQIWRKVGAVFAHFDIEDSWRAFAATIEFSGNCDSDRRLFMLCIPWRGR